MKKVMFFVMCVFLFWGCNKDEYNQAAIDTEEYSDLTWQWSDESGSWVCTIGGIGALVHESLDNSAVLVYAVSFDQNTGGWYYIQLPVTMYLFNNISTTYMFMLENFSYLTIYAINSNYSQQIKPGITQFRVVVIQSIPDKSNAINNLSYEEVISKYKCKEYDIMVK